MDIVIHGANPVTLPVSVILSCLSLAFIFISFLIGAFRGIHRSIVRIGLMLVSAVTAFAIALPDTSSYYDKLMRAVSAFDVAVIAPEHRLWTLLSGYAAIFGAPFVFFASFIALNIIAFIIYLLIALIFFPSRKYARAKQESGMKRHRILGAVVGALTGVLFVACVNLPVYGYTHFATDELNDSIKVIDDIVEFKNTNGIHNVISKYTFGKAVFHKLTEVDVNGQPLSMRNDGKCLSESALYLAHAASVPVKHWTEEEKAGVALFFEHARSSDAVAELFSATADFAREAMMNEGFMDDVKLHEDIKAEIYVMLQKLAAIDNSAHDGIVETFESAFFALTDTLARHSADSLTYDMIISDEQALYDLCSAVFTHREFDDLVVVVMDHTMMYVAEQLSITGEYRVNGDIWRNSTDEERIAEAELIAEMIPKALRLHDDTVDGSEIQVKDIETMLKLKNSILIGAAANSALNSMVSNLLLSFSEDKEPVVGEEGQPAFSWEGRTEMEIIQSLPNILIESTLPDDMMYILPDAVNYVELDKEASELLQSVVDEIAPTQEVIDGIPDYLWDFLEKYDVTVKSGS